MKVRKVEPQRCFDAEPFEQALSTPQKKWRMRDGDIYVVEGEGCLVVLHAFRSYGRTMVGVTQGHGYVLRTDIKPKYYGEKEVDGE